MPSEPWRSQPFHYIQFPEDYTLIDCQLLVFQGGAASTAGASKASSSLAISKAPAPLTVRKTLLWAQSSQKSGGRVVEE
jgi:hypothetical protein